eukprot:1365621-Amorphochlora_amoeboformis.AAC.2
MPDKDRPNSWCHSPVSDTVYHAGHALAQERKIAAIRKQNAKSDAKFNVQFVEKFKRTINLLPGVRELAVEKESKVMDDGDESDLGRNPYIPQVQIMVTQGLTIQVATRKTMMIS